MSCPREYRSRFASEETVSFCLRVMVGVIILYDYVHPVGAFAKSSKIDVSSVSFATQVHFRTSSESERFVSCSADERLY